MNGSFQSNLNVYWILIMQFVQQREMLLQLKIAFIQILFKDKSKCNKNNVQWRQELNNE